MIKGENIYEQGNILHSGLIGSAYGAIPNA
jgi:hypothetical protein